LLFYKTKREYSLPVIDEHTIVAGQGWLVRMRTIQRRAESSCRWWYCVLRVYRGN